ncbi:tetratricopeptide repeat protein [Pseudomonadota bacterium]
MKAYNGLYKKLLIAVLAVGLLSACGGKEERKAKYLERGKTYLAEKNYDKAAIEFKNVLQIDPKDANGYLFLGQIEEKQRNWRKAFGYYKKASELDPELIEPRVRLATFYRAQASALKANKNETGAVNALGLVQEQINEIRARDPENINVLTLEAAFWADDGETDKAVSQLEKVIEREPGLQSAAVLLSSLYDQQERADDAEAVLINAVKANPDPVTLQQQLATHYVDNKQYDEAEAVLRQLIEENPGKLTYRLSLASFLGQSGQNDKAEQVWIDAITADPEDVKRYIMLTEFLATQKSEEAAIEKLKQFIRQRPGMTDLQLSLVRHYLANEQKDEAKQVLQELIDDQGKEPTGLQAQVVLAQILASENVDDERVPVLLQEVLDENPRDNNALLLKGKLAANKKDYVGAVNDFRSVLKDQPNNTEVLQMLAAAHVANDEKELALDTLRRGIDSQPDNTQLRVSLAQLLAQDGDLIGALEQLDAALKVDKYNQLALSAKYELLARKGDAAGMDEVTRLMQEGAPESEEGYILEARLRFAEKKYEDAIVILDKVLVKNPDHGSANMLLGAVYVAQKDYAQAEQVFERQIEINPDSASIYVELARARLATDNIAGAIQAYEQGLQKIPDDIRLLIDLAGLREQQKDYDSAITLYEQVLLHQPNNAVGTNNLVAMLADHRSDEVSLARARELSAQLEKTNQPAFLDTAAWVYYRTGDYDKAAEILEGVVEKAPKVAVFRYHLGMVYSKQGKKDAARKHLTLATDGDFNYQGIEEALSTLNSL